MSIIDRIRAWSKRRREAWPNAARELGGTHHPQSRWWRNDEHILANVDGATVKLDSYTVSTGKSSATYTRVVAPSGPSVRSTGGYGSRVMVARADVQHDAFDIIDGKLAGGRVLPQAAHVHLARAGSASFADGVLAWRDLELDAERLRAGAALLGALAAGGTLYR